MRILIFGGLSLGMVVVALLPWWRNHDYLRDFYDYGVFINANARIAQGQRPWVDFTTPGQIGSFVLNYAAERLGGGTYIGMTRGAAALIIAGVLGLSLLLARRWPPLLAILISGAVIISSASQHTILFYNPLGVLAMAMVLWSFATAPLLRREDLGWHALAAIGLFLGGLNKINFHLLTCAMALGWVVFGAVERKAGLRTVFSTILFVAFFGLLLPVATEIAWTGAAWGLWYHNVIELPLQARGGRVMLLGTSGLYLKTLHDYYGHIRLPQAGLLVVVMPLLAAAAAWRLNTSLGPAVRRTFLALAALVGALSGIALLLTNNEISYVTLSAALVVTVSLWLGFGARPGGWWFRLGLMLPVVLVGALSWESAWQGQRSQFGHSSEPRSAYLAGETIGGDFSYLKGLKVPPHIAYSLMEVSRWRNSLEEKARPQIFYGPGCEWLEHVWPADKVPGLGLIAGAFDGAREQALFHDAVIAGKTFRHLIVPEAWESWDAATQEELSRGFLKQKIGHGYYLYQKLADGVVSARPLEQFTKIGGNADTTRVQASGLEFAQLSDGRGFLGTRETTGEMVLLAASYRTAGEAVLRRLSPGVESKEPVRFEIFAVGQDARYPRWVADVVLPDGKDELVLPTGQIDASGLPLAFTVRIPEQMRGSVVAGWRGPILWNTVEQPGLPPLLQPGVSPLQDASGDLTSTGLPEALREGPVHVRDARLKDGQCFLPPGGELWIRLRGLFTKITITASYFGSHQASGTPPMRIIYYKGGRLEFFHPTPGETAGTFHYKAWSPEYDGWLAILVDPNPANPALLVKIESAERP